MSLLDDDRERPTTFIPTRINRASRNSANTRDVTAPARPGPPQPPGKRPNETSGNVKTNTAEAQGGRVCWSRWRLCKRQVATKYDKSRCYRMRFTDESIVREVKLNRLIYRGLAADSETGLAPALRLRAWAGLVYAPTPKSAARFGVGRNKGQPSNR